MVAFEPYCSIERSLGVLGEKWTFLILREALLYGMTRFAEFQERLGVAPNILSDRLNTIVAAGVLEKRPYREEGSRPRFSYHATPAGAELRVVLAALQQWGDAHVPSSIGPTIERRTADGAHSVRVGFIDDRGRPVDQDEVVFAPTEAYAAASAASAALG